MSTGSPASHSLCFRIHALLVEFFFSALTGSLFTGYTLAHIILFIKLLNSNQELLDKETFSLKRDPYVFFDNNLSTQKVALSCTCVAIWEDCSTKLQMFDKKLSNMWYLCPGFRMFMLTCTTVHLNVTSDTSNNKYMGRYNVDALKKYFYHLKQAFH